MSRPLCQQVDACQAKGAGHCRRCWGLRLKQIALDPETEQRRRQVAAERMGELSRKRWQDPEYRAQATEAARQRNTLGSPEAIARRDAPETREKIERSRIATVKAMTPEERRQKYGSHSPNRAGLHGDDLAHYETLIRKRIPAPQARAMVDDLARRRVRRAANDMREKADRQKRQAY